MEPDLNNMLNSQMRITKKMIMDSPTFKCDCGGMIFVEAVMYKKISPLISPSGKEENIPISLIICNKCGLVPRELDKENEVPDELKTTKIKLI
jgi:hypothetical protein